MTDLSVLIVNWNTRELVCDLLTSLYENPPSVDYEVIVVDNASSDDSRQVVETEFPQVRLIANPSNVGFAKAVNRGIRESSGAFILLLNSDLTVTEGSIDAQLEFMNSTPSAAFCGGLLLDEQDIPNVTYGRFPAPRVILAEILPARIGEKHRSGVSPLGITARTPAFTVEIINGANLMARRSAIHEIGLLDERFFMYFEDADWCYRGQQLGWDVWCVPSAKYYHIGIASASSWSSFKGQWLKSMRLFIHKQYRGPQFMTCWTLWQLLRAKHVVSLLLMHLEYRLRRKGRH